jgi:flagellar protein FliJ
MAKQSTETLLFLKDMAAQEVESAMQALASAMKLLEDAKAQEAMLQQYQAEYEQQLNTATNKGMEAMLYQNFRRFAQQLEQAVTGQDAQLKQLEAMVQAKRETWQAAQRKQKSYEVLIDRATQQAQKVHLKREQKLMDEFAGRAKRA